MFIIKSVIKSIAAPLSHIFNFSFSSGRFPTCFKSSVISPIYKKGSSSDVNNYRPISLLSNFSKILEKLVYYRLIVHLEEENLLNKEQFGFRAGRSTGDAVGKFLKDLDTYLSARNHAIGLFIDLSKAFDRVNQSILLSKLPHYGVTHNSLSWFQSYLAGRSQTTKVSSLRNGLKSFVHSSSQNVNLEVPQDSILGPILFLLYINDIVFATAFGRFTLFADDTTILVEGGTRDEVISKLTDVLSQIQEWFSVNELTMNAGKTTYMYFNNPSSTLDPTISNSLSV